MLGELDHEVHQQGIWPSDRDPRLRNEDFEDVIFLEHLCPKSLDMKLNGRSYIGERFLIRVALSDDRTIQSQWICNVATKMLFNDHFGGFPIEIPFCEIETLPALMHYVH